MSLAEPRPLVGVSCCRSTLREAPYHVVAERYLAPMVAVAKIVPLLIPALADAMPVDDILDRLDGLFLTGSPSNIEPHHYDGPAPPENNQIDPARDATTLPLIRRAVARGIPVLGICRGMQEMNVALGGSLFQQVQEVPGRRDHRCNPADPTDRRYGPAHEIEIRTDGWLYGLAQCRDLTVNSLHGQGIDRLAPGLAVEAVAPDGQIEAVRLTHSGFCVGLQWHPEYRFADNPVSVKIFERFGAACRSYAARRTSIGTAA